MTATPDAEADPAEPRSAGGQHHGESPAEQARPEGHDCRSALISSAGRWNGHEAQGKQKRHDERSENLRPAQPTGHHADDRGKAHVPGAHPARCGDSQGQESHGKRDRRHDSTKPRLGFGADDGQGGEPHGRGSQLWQHQGAGQAVLAPVDDREWNAQDGHQALNHQLVAVLVSPGKGRERDRRQCAAEPFGSRESARLRQEPPGQGARHGPQYQPCGGAAERPPHRACRLHHPASLRVTLHAIVPGSPRSARSLKPTGELLAVQTTAEAGAAKVGREKRVELTIDRGNGMSQGNTRSAVTAFAAAIGLFITLSACSSGEGASEVPSATPTMPASTTQPATPADTAKQQAIAAYVGMWSDMADAATTSDWQSPKLAQNATGEALQTISRSLYADHYNGLVTKGRPVNHPEVTSVDPLDQPTSITITDCGDSTNWLKYHVDNDQPADDVPGGRRHIEALVKKAVDGSWKVTTFAVHEVGSCSG